MSDAEANVTIRDATPADGAAIVALMGELAASLNEPNSLDAAYVARYLATPGMGLMLAWTGQRAVGLLSYMVRPNLFHAAPACQIENLGVAAGYRSRGIGGKLVEELLRRAAALGCAEVSVTTMPDNADAIRFYRRHGLADEALYLELHLSDGLTHGPTRLE